MSGIRRFLRDFTASAVKEHLRSEIELLRFVDKGSFDWGAFLSRRSDA